MGALEFLFDFGSPNAYLAHRALPALEARTGKAVDYTPILLGALFKLTGNVPPLVAFKDVKGKTDYMRIEMRRFMRNHAITQFKMNPAFPVNTIGMMRGAVVAKRDGFLPAYVEACFHHMWEAPKPMGDPAVMAAALTESGLDAVAIMRGIEEPEVKAELVRTTQHAVDRGVFGSPSFFVGSELFFGKDSLPDVEIEIRRHTQAAA